MKEGDEERVEASLVFCYQEPDESVGIYGGFYLIGLEVEGDFFDLDERGVRLENGTLTRRIIFEQKAGPAFEKLAADMTASMYDDD